MILYLDKIQKQYVAVLGSGLELLQRYQLALKSTKPFSKKRTMVYFIPYNNINMISIKTTKKIRKKTVYFTKCQF